MSCGGVVTRHSKKYLDLRCLEMQNHVCHSFHDDVRGGGYCRRLGNSIRSRNWIMLNPKGGQAYK